MNVSEVAPSLEKDAAIHESVGYLIEETEHAIAVAHSRNADPTSEDNYSTRFAGVTVIPKAAVVDGPLKLRRR